MSGGLPRILSSLPDLPVLDRKPNRDLAVLFLSVPHVPCTRAQEHF